MIQSGFSLNQTFGSFCYCAAADAVMSAEPDAEANQEYNLPPMADSDDSEESCQEEEPATNWSEMSIIERVGLNSVELSEKDLEATFSQISMAFRCDQYTLKQRLQAEEHARNLAEENIHLELARGRETLEMLKSLCLDSKRSQILQKLELCLDILGGTVERISNTAEVLGAVHQEARVSRAVELMVAHVEGLRRKYDRNAAELEEAKKSLQQQQQQQQQSLSRNLVDPRTSSDPEENDNRKKMSQHNNLRRRVSISLISSQIQDKRKQDLKKSVSTSKISSLYYPSPSHSSESSCSAVVKDEQQPEEEERLIDPEETPSEAPQVELLPESVPPPEPECPPTKPVTTRKTQNKNSSVDTLRQRHRGKAALSKKKKAANIHRQNSKSPLWGLRPPSHWLSRCRWTLLCSYMFGIFCVSSLMYFLWKLQDGATES